MPNVANDLWFAHALLVRGPAEGERQEGIKQAARVLAELPSPNFTRDLALEAIEAARGGDADARRELAESLSLLQWLEEKNAQQLAEQRAREKAARAKRKAAFTLLKQATKAGVPVARVELDGMTLVLGEPIAGEKQGNELDQWIAKHHAH